MRGDGVGPQEARPHWLGWLAEAGQRPGSLWTTEFAQQPMHGPPRLGRAQWERDGVLPAFPASRCGDTIEGRSPQGPGCLFPPLLKTLTFGRGCTMKLIPCPPTTLELPVTSYELFSTRVFQKTTQELKAVEGRGTTEWQRGCGGPGQGDGQQEAAWSSTWVALWSRPVVRGLGAWGLGQRASGPRQPPRASASRQHPRGLCLISGTSKPYMRLPTLQTWIEPYKPITELHAHSAD